MQKDTKNSRWAWDTRRGFDNQEPREVYVGDYCDWDPEETRKQRWTEPTTPGAKKAIHSKEDPEAFKIGRYLCCHDPECGVSVKVVQASIVTWHFKRQWTYGKNNPDYMSKCKNELVYKGGESMYHNTTTRTIARLLTPGKKLGGKIIAEKAEWEVFRNFELKDGKSVKLKPDVFVKFTDDTWFAIEVVFGHPPERTAHDAYGTNMVELDLKKLRVVNSEQSFFKWIREGGIEKALRQESKDEQRTNRHEMRNGFFARYDEKQHLAAREEEISRCITKFGFYISPKILGEIDKIENIEDVFEQEQKLIKKLNRIQKAIDRNVEQYGEWTSHIPKSPSDFASVTEVDKWYQQEDKMIQKRRSIENAIARNAKKYGETLSRSAESFSLVREVDEYYQTELGEKKQWDKINKEFPEYKQWINCLLLDITVAKTKNDYKEIDTHCKYLESDLKKLIAIPRNGDSFMQKLIQQNLISSLPLIHEWDKWGQVDKLLKPHTLKSLEVVRIACFGKYGGGIKISKDIELLFKKMEEEKNSIKNNLPNVVTRLTYLKRKNLFRDFKGFKPNFGLVTLLDNYSESYTYFQRSGLGQKENLVAFIIDYIESNRKLWKGLGIDSRLVIAGLSEQVDKEIANRKERIDRLEDSTQK